MINIIAVTSCVTGIAHTYLAAESLKIAANALNVHLKVETRGQIGVENKLNASDIEQAIGVIVASDVKIDLTPFNHRFVLVTNTKEAIQNPQALIKKIIERVEKE